MTEAEKMMETLRFLSKNEELKREQDFNNMAGMTRQIYCSYVKAGFTQKQAMELTKEMVNTAILAGTPKK